MTAARTLLRAVESPDAAAFLLRIEVQELRAQLDKAERQLAEVASVEVER